MHAISTIVCCSTSRPVISRSSHTSWSSSARAVMSGTLSVRATGSRSHGLDSAADGRSPRRLAPRRSAAARQQRGPVHGGRAHRRLRHARRGARSTSPSGSGTRSCASSGCRSTRRTTRVLDTSAGIEWATWFVGGRCNAATMCLDRLDADAPAVVWEGEDGATRTLTGAELRALTDRIASGLAARGVRRGRRGRAVHADGARDGRRAVRDREARRDLPADLLGLRRRRGRDPAAGRGGGRGRDRRRLHAARQGRRDEGDGRRGRRAGRRACTPSWSSTARRDDTPMHAGRDVRLDDLPDAPFTARSVDSEHPLFVAYTSGTTGRPKGAVHVHAGLHGEGRARRSRSRPTCGPASACSGSPTSAGSWGRGRSSARSPRAARC